MSYTWQTVIDQQRLRRQSIRVSRTCTNSNEYPTFFHALSELPEPLLPACSSSRCGLEGGLTNQSRFDTFGTVYGLAMTLSGLLGLILTPLDIFTKNQLDGNYTPVNVSLLILGLITAIGLGVRVWSFTKRDGGSSGKIRLAGEEGVEDGMISGISRISGAIREEDEDE
jgi:hypothetical protein